MNYAFDIGGSKIEFAAFDATGKMVSHSKMATPANDRAAFVGAITALIDEKDRQFGATPAIGVSLAGGIDPWTGTVVSANIPAIKDWALAMELAKILDRPVYIENDADCFALAEVHSGVAKEASTVFAIILGTGVGGGIIFNGNFIGGRSGFRGEWGHGNDVSGTLMRHGLRCVRCGCGRSGCLDPWGAARGLETIYTQIGGKRLSSVEITEAWRAGEKLAERGIEIFVDLIAGELALIINVLDPDCVPVGGGMASESGLIAKIDSEVCARALGRYDRPLIVPGKYYRDGGLRGAALLHGLKQTQGEA